MHTGTLKKWALALTFWLALHLSTLRAQTFTAPLQASTTGTNPVDFEFRADGTMIALGNYGIGSLVTADQGAGTRMLWYPKLAAFRAGKVSGTLWDASNIGAYSVAFGNNTKASGIASTAFGAGNTAFGDYATATGTGSIASGWAAIALGSAALASEESSIAIGEHTTASGPSSLALGGQTLASGLASTALGGITVASGDFSTSSGYYTKAQAYDSFVIGIYNVGGGNANTWIATDPLFEIGNGHCDFISSPVLSDAFVVYKNGNAALQGTLTVAPGGDIPMYSGN